MRTIKTKRKLKHNKIMNQKRLAYLYQDKHSRYDDQELDAMNRSPKRHDPQANLFCVLARELFWKRFEQKHPGLQG